MKYMTFNSSCAYAGLANLLEQYGVETTDRGVALEMGLPYFMEKEGNCYLAGASLQSKKWFDLFLNPKGFAFVEENVACEEICTVLDGRACAMLGILVAPNSKHAVVYTGKAGEMYRFLNNKWEHSDEPEALALTKEELEARLDAHAMVATLRRIKPFCPDKEPVYARSLEVFEALHRDMTAFCEVEQTAQELRTALDPLFRALLLDGVAMAQIAGKEALAAELRAMQGKLMGMLRMPPEETFRPIEVFGAENLENVLTKYRDFMKKRA